jgi:hypothetical protein
MSKSILSQLKYLLQQQLQRFKRLKDISKEIDTLRVEQLQEDIKIEHNTHTYE